ncbi:MAG: hypothetical protein RL701_7978 [Pseudomonadota bacterium]
MRTHPQATLTMEVLLVEDSLGDVRLTREALRDASYPLRLHVVHDGVEAMRFLRHTPPYENAPRPDLILLDLNLPRMDGREVLAQVKSNHGLRTIPTIVLTTSAAESDVLKSYELQANCFLAKPVELDAFENLVRSISDFWLTKAILPHHANAGH